MSKTLTFAALSLLTLAVIAVGQDRRPPENGQESGETATAEDPKAKWAEHMGDLPFVIGYEKGMQQVELTGAPPMYFFTATW